jgi:hypothetical protein
MISATFYHGFSPQAPIPEEGLYVVYMSTRASVSSSELGPPPPSPASECVSPQRWESKTHVCSTQCLSPTQIRCMCIKDATLIHNVVRNRGGGGHGDQYLNTTFVNRFRTGIQMSAFPMKTTLGSERPEKTGSPLSLFILAGIGHF